MLQYIVKRLFLSVITLLVIMFASYCMLRLAPGSDAAVRSNFMENSSGGVSSSEKNEYAENESLKKKLKLDKPIHIGFAEWIADIILRGDFGESATVQPGKPVLEMISERLPITIKLNLLAITGAYIMAIIIGVYSAKYSESIFDRSTSVILFLLYSLPAMWVAMLLQSTLCEGGIWEIFPLQGHYEPTAEVGSFDAILKEMYYFTLPAVCLAYGSMTGLARYTRSNMLDVLNSDFIRSARAKGISETKVLWKHAFGNTLITLVTLFAGLLPSLIAGSIIIEHIFNIPGMGTLSLLALSSRDYPLLMVLFAFSGALTLFGILLADILYTVVDPRVKLK